MVGGRGREEDRAFGIHLSFTLTCSYSLQTSSSPPPSPGEVAQELDAAYFACYIIFIYH